MLTYALALAVLARANAVAKALVQLIAWGNLGWAALALALPRTGVLLPSAAGWLLLGAHVAGTALFAGLQLVGLRQSRTAEPGRSTQLKARGGD